VASGSGAAGGAAAPGTAAVDVEPDDPLDNDNDLEGCGVAPETHTADEDLPPAEGGVG
jgi:hypothetical protein